MEEEVGRVHGEHEEFAMSEVDDAGYAEDQRQADTDKRIDAALQKSVDRQLDQLLQHSGPH